MPGKRYTPEQIITLLREAEVKQSQGASIREICKQLAITDQTYYRWRKEYGGLKVDQAKRMKRPRAGERPLEEGRGRPGARRCDLEGSRRAKLLSPSRRRRVVVAVCTKLAVSERRACQVLGQERATQRYRAVVRDDAALLTAAILERSLQYGRYGYRRITGLLRNEGWRVNTERVERIWRVEGLKVPRRQRPKRRLWLADGACVRLRPERKDHVWAYDFVAARTHDGRLLRMLTIVDEYTRECLAIDVARRLTSDDVLARLTVSRGSRA